MEAHAIKLAQIIYPNEKYQGLSNAAELGYGVHFGPDEDKYRYIVSVYYSLNLDKIDQRTGTSKITRSVKAIEILKNNQRYEAPSTSEVESLTWVTTAACGGPNNLSRDIGGCLLDDYQQSSAMHLELISSRQILPGSGMGVVNNFSNTPQITEDSLSA